MCQYLFQLTTSRRGRPCPGRSRFLAVEFQLTTSRRGRRRICDIVCRISYFNSRPHEEVDELFVPLPITHSYFNSRPHEEVDNEPKCFIGFNLNISTHDLTKRSTIISLSLRFIGQSFNSRPHEEVDVVEIILNCTLRIISTHDLTKRSTGYSDLN